MQPLDLFCLKTLWQDFFASDSDSEVTSQQRSFFEQHERYGAIQAFNDFFNSQCTCQIKHNIFEHHCLLQDVKKTSNLEELNVELNLTQMSAIFPYDDFISTLSSDPLEVIGCLNMAVSILLWTYTREAPNPPYLPFPIFVRLNKIPGQVSSFSDLKANSCGRLLSIKGHVIRVSACSPLISTGTFKCTKCGEHTTKHFVDGIFAPVCMSM
jgi:DNA replicative helicase MCM subunit Mcm2 (Cdc46/Mcm family)